MSYANQAALTADTEFVARVDACATEQALVFQDDGRADIAALAREILLAGGTAGFVPLIAAQPGFGDVADQTEIADAQILSAVQAVWPTVAALRYPTAA